jgi:large subunit ribosomal protein L15
VVNVAAINALFPQGGDITIADLVEAGAVRKGELVKVLGQGDISVAVNVTADKFSDSAKAKITAAGGTVNQI